MKKLLLGLLAFLPLGAHAGTCDEWMARLQSQPIETALPYYEMCALSDNNDAVEMILARAYEGGEKNVPANMQKALLFYHLSADNGNSEAQVALAKLLMKLDESTAGRQELSSYMRKIQAAMKNQPADEFKGQVLHPYTLLLLAAERADQKWYYPSTTTSAPEAAKLLKAYKIDDVKKKGALRDASVWKQQKMMQAARQVLSPEEYKTFAAAVAPAKGKADTFAKNRALETLKTKVKAYREN